MFLKISQNWQENTCVRVSFLIKLQASVIRGVLQNTPDDCFYLLDFIVSPLYHKIRNADYYKMRQNFISKYLSFFITKCDKVYLKMPQVFYYKRRQFRSSHSSVQNLQCSVKKGVLKSLANFTGKHLCWCTFLIKLHPIRPATLPKIDSNTGAFLWNLRKMRKRRFFKGSLYEDLYVG